jgi:hypothetical protein
VLLLKSFTIKEIRKIRYPELETILHQYPNPHVLLGLEIFWQEKRDGSNIGVWLTRGNKIRLRSRNMDEASKDFHRIFSRTDEAEKIKELLIDIRDEWHRKAVIFGELLTKGKSPTRTEIHEKDEFIVFDIWCGEDFLPYALLHQYCYQYKLPIVELYGTSKHITLESLMEWRDKMLETAKSHGREGVVGKTFGARTRYFKEKLDLPKIEKLPRHLEEGKPQLPALPESETLGALDKALVDLGIDKFKDKSKGMPLFVQYARIECGKHNCSMPSGLFKYYEQKIKDMVK